MHPSAYRAAELFRNTYTPPLNSRVLEVGSAIIAGQPSLRDIFKGYPAYTGIDFDTKPGVDIVLTDPYSFPLPDNSYELIVCSSVLEHSEFFWLTFLEMARVLASGGLMYINVPSAGDYHRFPVDCWRFFPDSSRALERWAQRSNIDIHLLESYIHHGPGHKWNDFVAIFTKGESLVKTDQHRIINHIEDYKSAWCYGMQGPLKPLP